VCVGVIYIKIAFLFSETPLKGLRENVTLIL